MQKKEKKSSYKNNDVMTKPVVSNGTHSDTFVKEMIDVVAGKDLIELERDDATILKNNEQNVLQYKLRVADIELTIANFNKEKADLINLIKSEQEEFVANARKFALKNGINPDGEPTGDKWNLDTSTMVFHKLK